MERYIGLDVHAASTTFAVVGESGKRLGTHVVETNGQALVEQLKTIPGKRHVCLEEGTQSTWLYEILSPHAEEVLVVMVSESRGQKNDAKDAFDLAEQLRTGAIKKHVFKEVGEYGTLRELSRTHTMVVQDVVRVQNRIKALFRSRGIAVVGKSVYSEKGRDTTMSDRLDGKIALITGATSGIGLSAARLFVAEGAHVYITGRRLDAVRAAVAEIGGNVTGIQADSSNDADFDRVYAQVKNEASRIDVLFANAGGGTMLPLGKITEEHVDAILGGNVKALIFTVQKALPLLVKGSSIILTGSSAGIEGTAAFSVYSASKAAVRSLARSWVLDLKDAGIRVNVLSPGAIRTPFLLGFAGDDAAQQQGMLDYLATRIPLGRVGEPDEVARAALFLASDDASFVNGAELFADGGQAQV